MKYLMIIWISWKIFNSDFKMWVQILGLFTGLMCSCRTCLPYVCVFWFRMRSGHLNLWLKWYSFSTISSVKTMWNWPVIVVCLDCWHNRDICCVLLFLSLLLLFLLHHLWFSYFYFYFSDQREIWHNKNWSCQPDESGATGEHLLWLRVLVMHSSLIQLRTVHCHIPGACLNTEILYLGFECAGLRPKELRFLTD